MFALIACWTVACAGPIQAPPRSPLAQMSYDSDPPTLYVGDRSAQVSPYNDGYLSLLDGESRKVAEKAHKQRLIGAVLNLVAAAGSITALALAVKYDDQFLDLDTAPGRAEVGLAISSALVGAVGGTFTRRGRAGVHRAVHLYNQDVLARDFVPKTPAQLPPVPLPVAPAPAPALDVAPAAADPSPAAAPAPQP
jgi:hypothetical protein